MSAMKVHHLNCGTMRVPTFPVVAHVLLIETGNGLVLVDSGYGLEDIADPARRIGPVRHLIRPALNPAETAARQVERLGFRRDDVRHIILTHLDVEHTPAGDKWRGFAAAEQLDAIASGIVLISLPGHTRGHAAVAVNSGDRWLLHAGDAFYHHGTLGHSRMPAVLRAGETLVAYDLKKVRDNHTRLAELHQRSDPALVILCSHDPALYESMRTGT